MNIQILLENEKERRMLLDLLKYGYDSLIEDIEPGADGYSYNEQELIEFHETVSKELGKNPLELECPHCSALVDVSYTEKYESVTCYQCLNDSEFDGNQLIEG